MERGADREGGFRKRGGIPEIGLRGRRVRFLQGRRAGPRGSGGRRKKRLGKPCTLGTKDLWEHASSPLGAVGPCLSVPQVRR